jgi:hypothetical protein
VDVPLWAAILIGLGSGVIGTLARIAYDRNAEIRNRMIQAADDFTISLFKTITILRDAESRIDSHSDELVDDELEWIADIQDALDTVSAQVDDLHERLARVQLLFGASASSPTTQRGHSILTAARNAHNALRDSPSSVNDPRARQQFNRNNMAVMNGVDPFTETAREELRAWTIVRWARRVRSGRDGRSS